MKQAPLEWARLYRGPGSHQPELLHAQFVTHLFALHAHDEYVIAGTESGVQVFRCGRRRKIVPPNHLFMIQPGDAHVDEQTPDGYCYRAFYPPADLVMQFVTDMVGRACTELPVFCDEVVYDPEAAEALTRFHAAVAERGTQLEQEAKMYTLLALLLFRYGVRPVVAHFPKSEHRAVKLARERLDAEFARRMSLEDLAALGGLSAYHFERVFAAEVGLPAHAYQEMRRMTSARQLLAEGMSISSVALNVGYPDQAHFTRRFKRFVGVTPGVYAKSKLAV